MTENDIMNRPGITTFVSLPDIFTLTNGTLGFLAIYFILIGNLLLASRIVFLCIFFDSFDGFLARRNNNCAEFGKTLDSLSDIISFGIVPSFIFIDYGNNTLLGILIGAIYVISGLLRLSRFNALNSQEYFGLPITMGAIFVTLLFLAGIPFYLFAILLLATSILFISNFKIIRPSNNGKSLVIFSTIFVFISLIPYPPIRIVSRLLLILLPSIFLLYLFRAHRS
ncbi:MAG TPA: CDP-diacylglycerol--serine O-phosphatidyltransferase [Methanofastidiosum sp.]|nr:CDP-diacylglycerol--serine O-phosphatidyltransferase [Methanofastidiosum sp.]HOI77660.1 CDP-diacylglycerol--serine O-phosphatidyltransferase [Methanofastidiosum sp.]